jgi:O-antigen ligase
MTRMFTNRFPFAKWSDRSWLSPALPAVLLLYGLLFMLVLTGYAEILWSQAITAFVYILAAVWMVAIAFFRPAQKIKLISIDFLFIGFLLLIAISFAVQGFSSPGIDKYAKYVPFLMILPYVCGRMMLPRDVSLLTLLLTALSVLTLFFMVAYGAGNSEMAHYRPTIFGGDEITARAAHLLAFSALPVSAVIVSRMGAPIGAVMHRPFLLSLALLLALILFVQVYLGLRGILLSLLLALVLLSAKAAWLSWRGKLAFLSCVTIVIGVGFAILPSANSSYYVIVENLANVGSSTNVERCAALIQGVDSVAIREVLYGEAIQQFLKHPWLGVGAAGFGKYSCWADVGHPHSTILQAFAELGLFGGLLLLATMAVPLYRFSRLRWPAEPTMIAIPLFLFFSAANTQINGSYFLSARFWFALGMSAALMSRLDEDTKVN